MAQFQRYRLFQLHRKLQHQFRLRPSKKLRKRKQKTLVKGPRLKIYSKICRKLLCFVLQDKHSYIIRLLSIFCVSIEVQSFYNWHHYRYPFQNLNSKLWNPGSRQHPNFHQKLLSLRPLQKWRIRWRFVNIANSSSFQKSCWVRICLLQFIIWNDIFWC